MTVTTKFESETCGRCGGSGKFSFNMMHGDRCYGCSGTGAKLTRRGAAARAFYLDSLRRPVSDIKVGDQVWTSTGVFGGDAWHIVTEIKESASRAVVDGVQYPMVDIMVSRKGRKSGLTVHSNSVLQVVGGKADQDQLLAAAVAYQGTLSKTGRPLKRKVIA
jgi:hypothetical protein